MTRKIPKNSHEEIVKISMALAEKHYGEVNTDRNALYNVIQDMFDEQHYTKKFNDDVSKIDFDFENYDVVKIIDHDGAPIEICYAGGDWEYPIKFALYWDGKHFRGYVPEKGNLYNIKRKSALGNYDEDEDVENVKKWAEKNHVEIKLDDDGHWADLNDNALFNEEIIKAVKERLTVV